MAQVKPFRAVRFGEKAGPLETLVAPPYDVISPEQREELSARSEHNVVRLTLPDDEGEAGRPPPGWGAGGVVGDAPHPGIWLLARAYVRAARVAPGPAG